MKTWIAKMQTKTGFENIEIKAKNFKAAWATANETAREKFGIGILIGLNEKE